MRMARRTKTWALAALLLATTAAHAADVLVDRGAYTLHANAQGDRLRGTEVVKPPPPSGTQNNGQVAVFCASVAGQHREARRAARRMRAVASQRRMPSVVRKGDGGS
jgi:hypothetical protein